MKTFPVVLVAFYAVVYGGKIINTSQSFSTHFFHCMLRKVTFTDAHTGLMFCLIIPGNEELKCHLRQRDEPSNENLQISETFNSWLDLNFSKTYENFSK